MKKNFSYLTIGISTGWLIGLSTAPVIAAVLGSLLGIISAWVSTISSKTNQKNEFQDQSTSNSTETGMVIALIILGLAAGAPFGVFVRENSTLRPHKMKFTKENANAEIEFNKLLINYWSEATGKSKSDIALEFFKTRALTSSKTDRDLSTISNSNTESSVGLFGSIIPNCERLQTIGDEFLESEIETMTGYFPELLAVTRDPTKLRKLVDISCKDL